MTPAIASGSQSRGTRRHDLNAETKPDRILATARQSAEEVVARDRLVADAQARAAELIADASIDARLGEDTFRVLDLCTGSGVSLPGLVRRGRLVLGVDASLSMLERAADEHGDAEPPEPEGRGPGQEG